MVVVRHVPCMPAVQVTVVAMIVVVASMFMPSCCHTRILSRCLG